MLNELEKLGNIKRKLFVAIDTDKWERFEALVTELAPYVCNFKIGLTAAFSPEVGVHRACAFVTSKGAREIFLDFKLHDIPQTITGVVNSFNRIPNISLMTVHAQTEYAGMKAAVDVRGNISMLAVTKLTSSTTPDWIMNQEVFRLTKNAREAGMQGVVCSLESLRYLRLNLHQQDFDSLIKVVPGIRPAWFDSPFDDQKYTATPEQALRGGADILVVGRPITEAESPSQAAQGILEEMRRANG